MHHDFTTTEPSQIIVELDIRMVCEQRHRDRCIHNSLRNHQSFEFPSIRFLGVRRSNNGAYVANADARNRDCGNTSPKGLVTNPLFSIYCWNLSPPLTDGYLYASLA